MRQVAGIHSVREVLNVRPRSVTKFMVRDNWKDSKELGDLVKTAKDLKIRTDFVGLSTLDKVLKGHQGILVEVNENPAIQREKWDRDHNQMVLALDGIEDPQNLGAIVRTAWLTGVSGVFLPNGRAAPMTAAACKVASGGAEHVPIETHSNVAAPLNILKEKGFWIFGLAHDAKQDLWSLKLPNKVAWAVGGEASGLRAQTLKACDQLVRLPQIQADASYNASVAAAIAMAETTRQWSANPRDSKKSQ